LKDQIENRKSKIKNLLSIRSGARTIRNRKTWDLGLSVEVVNLQRRRAIDEEHWRKFTRRALRAAGAGAAGATVVFVSDARMRKLNAEFRGKRRTTDVLSFPAEQNEFERRAGANLGDVVISVERAARQAAENEIDLEMEIAQLILHGLLHLHGYDHETDNGEMNRLELKLRRRLRIDV
jgi:probable rRNA maturation factor